MLGEMGKRAKSPGDGRFYADAFAPGVLLLQGLKPGRSDALYRQDYKVVP